MNRESFVFYKSFYEAIKGIPKKHQLAIYQAVFEYVFDNKEITLSGVSGSLWKLIKPQLDSSMKRYDASKKGAEYGKLGAEYGKLGGRPKKEKTPLKGDTESKNKNPLNVNVNDNDNSNVNDNENVNDNGNVVITPLIPLKGGAGEGFQIPSLSEVREYCQERQNSVDPEEFLDFYTSKGWLIGKTPMKDWKACVRTWEKNQRNKTAPDRYSDVDDWLRRRTGNESAGI